MSIHTFQAFIMVEPPTNKYAPDSEGVFREYRGEAGAKLFARDTKVHGPFRMMTRAEERPYAKTAPRTRAQSWGPRFPGFAPVRVSAKEKEWLGVTVEAKTRAPVLWYYPDGTQCHAPQGEGSARGHVTGQHPSGALWIYSEVNGLFWAAKPDELVPIAHDYDGCVGRVSTGMSARG